MKKLFLVNDDGIFAPGLDALINSVSDLGDVTVIAPHQEKSGMGQAITVNEPLRLTKVKKGYMLDGTPADCVKMGLQGLKLAPDLILSGINCGSNLGWDVLYSGTVGAALEGVLYGVPALAFSLCGSADYFSTATAVVRKLLIETPNFLDRLELIPFGGILNINIPALPLEEIKGFRITRLGHRNYAGLMQRRKDPRGNYYYWMGGEPIPLDSAELDIDLIAVEHGYVSVTPLRFDITFHEAIPKLQSKLQSV